MKAKKKVNMRIEDEKEIAELEARYRKMSDEYDEKVYNSRYSETSRLVRIIRSVKFKVPPEKAFVTLSTLLAKDMHQDLKYEDLFDKAFYRASGKNKKRDMQLSVFEPYEEIELQYFTGESQMVRNFKFKKRSKGMATKIVYYDLAKGKKAWSGPQDTLTRNWWIQSEILRFDIQILQLKKELGLLNEKQLLSFDKKIDALNAKLKKKRLFSK